MGPAPHGKKKRSCRELLVGSRVQLLCPWHDTSPQWVGARPAAGGAGHYLWTPHHLPWVLPACLHRGLQCGADPPCLRAPWPLRRWDFAAACGPITSRAPTNILSRPLPLWEAGFRPLAGKAASAFDIVSSSWVQKLKST